MTKKIIVSFLIFILVYAFMWYFLLGDDSIPVERLTYEFNHDDTITITGYDSEFDEVVFPNRIEGKKVTQLNITGVVDNNALSVQLPDYIESVSSSYFSQMSNLQSIEISNSNDHYTSIEGILYSNDFSTLITVPSNNGITEFTVPKEVERIERLAFSAHNSLRVLDFEEASQLEKIEYGAFMNAEYLYDVTFPDGLEIIGRSSFKGTNITSIEIPGSVRKIDSDAFEGAPPLYHFPCKIPRSKEGLGGSWVVMGHGWVATMVITKAR